MEPILLEDDRHQLADTCADLISCASGLARRLHPLLRASIGDLVRSMNCYYSNLIEGRDTHPDSIAKGKDCKQLKLQTLFSDFLRKALIRLAAFKPA